MKQSGFSLLEVLIAVLVLGIGLLGFAALQISSISTGEEGYFRSQALIIAQDLADRMRANRGYVNWDLRAHTRATGTVNPALDLNVYGQTGGTVYTCAAPPNPFCADNGGAPAQICNEQQMAAFDAYEVCLSAQNRLPGGQVRVVCTDANEQDPAVDPKPNPYQIDPNTGVGHPIFLPTSDAPDGTTLTGPDNDNCSPGSKYTIFVGWNANAVRADAGELAQIIDARCQATPADVPPGPGFPNGMNCVYVELIP
jgi:type IV pilus assembly protein PilV